MNRFLFAVALVFSLSAPAFAQQLTPDAYLKQSQAIAIRVQQQLIDCWHVPEGAEGLRIGLDVGVLGNGQLDGTAVIPAESLKEASKYPVLAESVLRAVSDCTPFTGLEELGAGTMERFSITVYFQS